MLHTRPTALAIAISAATLTLTAQAQETARLENIVVTAAGYEQALREAPASISVVTREELERKSFSNVAEAIADVPGVDVRSGTGKTGGLNVSIRGMPSDYTLKIGRASCRERGEVMWGGGSVLKDRGGVG